MTTQKPARSSKPARTLEQDTFALPGDVDLAVDLAPEHRRCPTKSRGTVPAFVLKLVEATRGAPTEPTNTRQLRLALATAEAFPAHTPAYLTWTLRAFVDKNPKHELADAARELRAAIFGATNHAKLARFAPMLRGAVDVIDCKRTRKEVKSTE
jgi:hypothetical protein